MRESFLSYTLPKQLRNNTINLVLILVLMLTSSASQLTHAENASYKNSRIHFDIPTQRADKALILFAEQAGLTLVFPFETVSKRKANAVKGFLKPQPAINQLLLDTGLTGIFSSQNTLRIEMTETNPMQNNKGLLATLVGALIGGSGAHTAHAQNENSSPIEEIIVTAQKREQNVQDIPVSVQVIGENQLEANSVTDFSDLSRVSPSLLVRPSETPANANISIRGVGTLAFSPSVEPSVAVVLDDVALAFQSRAFTDLADIERIEVLRGPQSTLYGKSASAGLINIVTKGPSDTFTAGIRTTLTNDDEQQVGLTASGPMSDTLGFRTSINYDEFDGNARNVATNDKINGKRYFSTRNKLRWNPNDQWQVDVGIDYADGKTTSARPLIELDEGTILRGNPEYTADVFAPGITADDENTSVAYDFVTGNTYDDFAQSIKVTYDFDDGPSLISITAHDRYNSHDVFDSDDSAIADFHNRQYGNFSTEQYSQELRLISPGSDAFRYTLGAYYNDVDIDRDFYRGPVFANSNWSASTGSEQIAAFGQLEYDLFENTTLIAGARYSRETIDYSYINLLSETDNRFSGDSDDQFGTYKLGIQQRINENVMIFATYATGHKGEAYDISSGFDQARADAGPIDPETSDDLQLGFRSELFDRKLTFNLTLFDSNFEDFQAQGIETLDDGTQNFRLTNVGELESRGVELETLLRPTYNLSISTSLTYLDAEITRFDGAPCYYGQTEAQGCVGSPTRQDLSGTRPQQAPRWKFNTNFDYRHPLGSLPLEVFARGALSYQSEVNYQLDHNPTTEQSGYAIVNLSLGLADIDGQWNVTGFVNNLFDEHYRYLLNDASSRYGGTAIQGYVPRDFNRYAGIKASYNF